MISRQHRFHGHGSLRYVYQHDQTIRGQRLSLRYTKNERQKSYRLAVVVSKKVSKRAITRNRIRRRIFEQVRLLEAQMTQPYDVVLTVFSEDLAEAPITEVASLVHDLLTKAHILQPLATSVHDKIEGKGE